MMNIKEAVKAYQQDMLRDLETLVSYNSVLDKTNPSYPFGKVNAECLQAALSIMDRMGLKTKNLDNYSGFGEVGQGDKMIGVLGHLDIVPAGEGWSSDPFKMVIKDNVIYGRGVADDKGPVIAGLYAIKILMDHQVPLDKRIRLIVGSNEESGSQCLDYYVKKEGHIDYGFTPDGSFPGVHGEKGFVNGLLKGKTSKIKEIKGGVAKNVVLTNLTATIEKDSFDLEALSLFLAENKLTLTYECQDDIILNVEGVSAHASTPEEGINALSFLMVGLKKAGINDEFVNLYNDLIGLSYDGSQAGIYCEDEYGGLTFNVGMVYQEGQDIYATIDIRYPVTCHHDEIMAKMQTIFTNKGGILVNLKGSNPLFYEPTSDMILALVKAYQSVTHDYDAKPEVIGGGTYSKGINNCIAFGGSFNGYDYHMHDKNENMTIDQLLLQTEIYVEAILNLLAI